MSNKVINKGLSYLLKNGEVYFYYDDKIVFMNSKSIPFITVKIKNNELLKEISLYNFTIEKKGASSFAIKFFDGNYELKCHISSEKNRVSFFIDNYNDYYEVCFTLYKENKQKVYGLNTYKNVKKKLTFKEKVQSIFDKSLRHKDLFPDQKLAFYIKEYFFFENKNIYDYEVDFFDNIYIKTKQKDIRFNLVYSENINIAINQENKNQEKITKFSSVKNFLLVDEFDINAIKKSEKHNKIKYDGIIINASDYNQAKTKITLNKCKKNGLLLIYIINTAFNLNGFLDEELYIDNSGIKKVNLDNGESVRKLGNVIRNYLNDNVDGIYVDGNYTQKEISVIHSIISTVTKEYYGTIVMHSTISENNDDFGYYIIKNKDLIERFESIHKYYLYSGENRIGREIPEFCNNRYKFLINIVQK